SKTKTGLGAQLDTAEAAWKGLNFRVLDARPLAGTSNLAAFDQHKQQADQYNKTHVAAAVKVITTAAVEAGKVKNNSALSSSAKKAAADIETGLLAQVQHLKGIKLDDFDTYKAEAVKHLQALKLQLLHDRVKTAEEQVKVIEGEPTLLVCNNNLRSLITDLKLDEMAKDLN